MLVRLEQELGRSEERLRGEELALVMRAGGPALQQGSAAGEIVARGEAAAEVTNG